MVYACLGETCHLRFRQNDRGLFAFHCGNTGVEQTLNKSLHTKLTLEKKILLLFLLGIKLTTFRSQVWCFTNKPSRLRYIMLLGIELSPEAR